MMEHDRAAAELGPATLGSLLIEYRVRSGLTQEEVAERAGVSVRALRNIELGTVTRPRRRTVEALLDVVGVGPDEADALEALDAYDAPAAVDTLPAPPTYFVGRAEAVDELQRYLTEVRRSEPATVLVVGAAGSGKTALAVHVAHRLQEQFPDGRCFLGFGREPSPSGAVTRMLRMFGLSGAQIPTEPDEQLELYHAMVADRRLLIVADNAAAAQARSLSPGPASRSALVVTSRSVLGSLDQCRRIVLPPLTDDDGVTLLRQMLGTERVDREEAAARRIVEYCDRLPLALRVAGGRLVVHSYRSLSWLADRLADGYRRLDELVVDDVAVRDSLTAATTGLSREARLLLGRLGRLDIAEVPVWVAAAAMDLPVSDVEELLDELVAMHLAEPVLPLTGAQHRFTLHDLVHAFAAELGRGAEREAVGQAAWRRVLGAALGRVEEARRIAGWHLLEQELPPVPRWGPTATREILAAGVDTWFERERAVLVAFTLQACDTGDIDMAYSLAYAMLDFFDNLRYDDDLLSTHDRIFDAAGALGHEVAQAYAASGRAVLNANRGRWTQVGPDMRFALEVFARHRAVVPRAELNQRIAMIHERLIAGAWDEARALAEGAVVAAAELGDVRVEASAQQSYGTYLAVTGRPAVAVAAFERGLELFEKAGAGVGVSLCRMRLGAAYAALGDHRAADAHLRHALEVSRAHNLQQSEPHILLALADNALQSGLADEAAGYLGASAAALERHGGLMNLARMHLLEGHLCELRGRAAEAEQRYRIALDYAGQAGADAMRVTIQRRLDGVLT
uniref:HTH cro/C1-type domain-containing protein n=1 Tax=uncultured bacterium esnapd8 TaxID=1366615 RepID=S5TUA5_9BACT|nr:hypothetical protein [uncultured bacterium esnapd8]